MNASWHYNNFGIEALGITFVLEHCRTVPTTKALLIPPILSHEKLLSHLARATTGVVSFEKYLIENIASFANFNQRYYDGLIGAINSIQLLNELEVIEISNGHLSLRKEITYSTGMGKRAKKIHKASRNIAALLHPSPETLYLNLRIEL